MKRLLWLVALLLLLIPGVSQAIQLHWSSGADTLTFAGATRCMLVVQADSAEVTLPPEWRLLWVGDSTEVTVVALDSLQICAGDTAQAYHVDGPATPDDSTAHRVTAQFCSGGSSTAERATYVLDLPAWGRGKLKAVALDPADSTAVIESNEVTFNGGVNDVYAPTILTATSDHPSSTLTVTAAGVGLSSIVSAALRAPNNSWSVPLSIVEHSDSRLVASAEVPVPLSATVLAARGGSTTAVSPLIAPDELELELPSSGTDAFFKEPDWPAVRPKDFAFYYTLHPYPQGGAGKWRGLFHLLYIRHFNNDQQDTSEVTFGHAWSSDLVNWTTDKNAFHTLARWDAQHVWAPSIILQGTTYYMFYTGVGLDGRERIGVATTSYLDTTNTVWQRDSAEVFDPVRNSVQWAKKAAGRACRDPWVTEYPAGSGAYAMLYVVQDSIAANSKQVVGLASCPSGNLRAWQDAGRYWSTVNDALYWGATRIESPMAFRAPTAVGGWRLMYTDGGQSNPLKLLRFETGKSASVALTDTVQGRWSNPTRLYDYLGSDPLLYNWQASEHLRLGDFDFFAAFADSGRIRISRMSWSDSNFVLHQSLADAGGVGAPEGRRFFAASGLPGSRHIEFGVVSPRGGVIRLAVYDVLGRRVWDVRDRQVGAGMNRVGWNCVDDTGRRVPAGLYFARCTGAGLSDVAKVVVVY